MEQAVCGNPKCGRSFPKEHATVCLIGTVLCPPCEVVQQRYPDYVLADDYDLAMRLDQIKNPGVECVQHDGCPCYDHVAIRITEAHNKSVGEKEEERMAQIRELAALPMYQVAV